jgi:hypothetical protein
MCIIFSASELETLMIKVLFRNSNWFNKYDLYKETKKFYKNNQSELTMCHFLFTWEKLLVNTNFIQVNESDNIEEIKISQNSCISTECDNTEKVEPDDSEDNLNFSLNLKETIVHMCDNIEIYNKSKVLDNFFKKNFPQYNSVYELLILNKQEIGFDNIICFIDLYSNVFELDEIINFIADKKYIKNRQISDVTNSSFNSVYTIIFKASFAGMIGILLYNLKWLHK